MTGMDDLIAFMRAQLDADERVARAADSGRWLPEDKGITFEYRADDFHGGEAQARLVADTRANQWHIANWDPARVLAEVEAKRRILDSAEHHARRAREDRQAGHPSRAVEMIRDTLHAVLLDLAQPYAGRDGWREEWTVTT